MKIATIGIIGAGRMGGAIARGLSSFTEFSAVVYDVSSEALQKLSGQPRVQIAENPQECASSDVSIIAVKPGMVAKVLSTLQFNENSVVISVAAGIPVQKIREQSHPASVCRVMPNLAVEIAKGVTGCFGDTNAVEAAREIFSSLGYFFTVSDEKALNALTGLSGSGPAFAATFVEAFADAGVLIGFPRDIALNIAMKVVSGTISTLEEKEIHPALFREMVSSPGGTTIEGLSVLEDYRFRKAIMEAIRAAARRAEELAGG